MSHPPNQDHVRIDAVPLESSDVLVPADELAAMLLTKPLSRLLPARRCSIQTEVSTRIIKSCQAGLSESCEGVLGREICQTPRAFFRDQGFKA